MLYSAEMQSHRVHDKDEWILELLHSESHGLIRWRLANSVERKHNGKIHTTLRNLNGYAQQWEGLEIQIWRESKYRVGRAFLFNLCDMVS